VVLPFTPLFVLALMHSESNVATVTGLISGLAAFAGTLGALWMGRLGDRVGHRKVFITGALSAAIFYLPHFFVSDIWQLVVLQFLVGISLGGIMPALSALLAQYTRDGDEGAVYGLENSVVAAARMVAPLIGASIVVWFSIELTFVMAGVLFLLTAALAFWYLPEHRPAVLKPVPAS
jgi:DHA1 family multidrug resistance protein-like MFS transporter